MKTDNSNRFRISTNFAVLKVVVFVGVFSIVVNLIKESRNNTISNESVGALTVSALAFIGITYFISTRNRIDYDDAKQILYIVDRKTGSETEVPVERIEKILYSAIGGNNNASYVIVFRDVLNQTKKVRLFPIAFDDSIETIKRDAKFKNPDLVTRNWSIGWNELRD